MDLKPNSFILLTIPNALILVDSLPCILKHLPPLKTIIFDTKGNFILSKVECDFISSPEVLLYKLNKLYEITDFILVIDSLILINEYQENCNFKKKCFNIMWDLIYKNNMTILIIDHYRLCKDKEGYKEVGYYNRWKNMFDYWIDFEVNENNISYSISENIQDNL